MVLTVTDIIFKKYRVIVFLDIDKNNFYTNKKFCDVLLDLIPTLKLHQCKNRDNNIFISELSNTNIAHAFEHVAIDLQSKYMLENKFCIDKRLYGLTSIVDFNKITAKIELSYWNDIIALKSISKASEIINSLEYLLD